MTIGEFLLAIKKSAIWKELPVKDRVTWAFQFSRGHEGALSILNSDYKEKLIDAFGEDAVNELISQMVLNRLKQ